MVAASKMKKAQSLALSGRPYAQKIAEMVKEFVKRIEVTKHPLLKSNANGKSLIVLISTNKGLCGGLNTNLFRTLHHFLRGKQLDTTFITLGKKGESFIVREKKSLLADFSHLAPFSQSVPALTTLITDGYFKSEFKEVYLLYNNFISALKQEPTLKKILPLTELTPARTTVVPLALEFLVEPSIDAILDTLLFHYLENQVRDAVLEAEASEHSARMIAMKNATDNANEFMGILTLEYNKARQEKITYEIADMVTARLAVE